MITILMMFLSFCTIYSPIATCETLHKKSHCGLLYKKLKGEEVIQYYSYYLDSDGKRIRDGIFLKKEYRRNCCRCIYTVGLYKDNKFSGVEYIQNWYGSDETYIENNLPVRIVSRDVLGKKIAECTLLPDRTPFTGSVWSLSWGLKGLKYSSVRYFTYGILTSEKEFEFEKISDLYNSRRKQYSQK